MVSVNSMVRGTVAIIGQGYVGLPLAMAAVDAGWNVIGVDNFESKVSQINSGSSPVEDITDEKLSDAISSGNYKATSEFSSVSQANVIAICVPTPLDKFREPDLTLLRSAASSIAKFVTHETLIVSESTSYPGTLRSEIIPIFESLQSDLSSRLYFASAPERVNPGDLVWSHQNTPRLVGGIDAESLEKAVDFYQSICSSVLKVATPEVAEAAKLLENTFRLVNIALVNEFSQICASSGINVNDVIEAASSKPYGYMPFKPGVGVGGHCIPVDPLYLTWWARKNGKQAPFVEHADSINQMMPIYVGQRALDLIQGVTGQPRILIVGVAYKSGVADTRETPALELRNYLESKGATVSWHDPFVDSWEGSNPVSLTWDCHLAIIAMNQTGVDIKQLSDRGILILDCTNSLKDTDGVTHL